LTYEQTYDRIRNHCSGRGRVRRPGPERAYDQRFPIAEQHQQGFPGDDAFGGGASINSPGSCGESGWRQQILRRNVCERTPELRLRQHERVSKGEQKRQSSVCRKSTGGYHGRKVTCAKHSFASEK